MRRPAAALATALLLLGALAPRVAAAPAEPVTDPRASSGALSGGQVDLTLVTTGLVNPVGVVNAGDGTNRLFVVEQRGTVRVVQNGSVQPGFFLDVRGASTGFTSGGERGLLGLAFHPDFASNRTLFVYYTGGGGALVIAEMTANQSRTSASVSTLEPILDPIAHPRTNHNGGQLLFGPDENLYIFTGDGGGSGDPDNNAQDVNSLLGKVLRVTPNLNGGRSIPADNPYVGEAGNDAIWATGLRNPWRASFDRANGNLWIGDVGQGSWEEINREPANTGGRNYGWNCREGFHAYAGCTGSFTNPVAAYARADGNCAVTGGYVYRGSVFPDFVGQYVLGDYCSGRIWTLNAGAGSPSFQFHRRAGALITSFGEAENGEIYMTAYGGALYRIVAPPFTDVSDSSLIDHIMWIYYEGISSGCGGGKYCPNEAVSRAQMAAFLSRALDLPPTANDYFDDDDGHPLEISINRVAAAGIASGCGTKRYCPEAPVTRGQMASFIDRALDLPNTSKDYFTDDDGLTHENAINRLAAAGITGGCATNRFCPANSTTRAQMAAFLKRAIGD